MRKQTFNLLLAFFLPLVVISFACCGVFHFGRTNADGSPKDPNAALTVVIRALSDTASQTYFTELVKEKAPVAFAFFDTNADGVMTLAEVEAKVNFEDPAFMTQIFVMGVLYYETNK